MNVLIHQIQIKLGKLHRATHISFIKCYVQVLEPGEYIWEGPGAGGQEEGAARGSYHQVMAFRGWQFPLNTGKYFLQTMQTISHPERDPC